MAEKAVKKAEETVRFRLFKDNDKYSGDVFVGVNGKGYIVKRGVEVEMPKAVYEVLKNKEKQDGVAYALMEKAEMKD